MLFPLRFRALTVSALAVVCALIPSRAVSQTSFSEHTIYNSSADQIILGHGDFNNDGREDFVVQQASSGGASKLLFLSNGDGTYDAPLTLHSDQVGGGTLVLNEGQFVVGDFNHDGNLDYAELDIPDKQVEIWIGHGDGTFVNNVDLSTATGPIGIAAADLNHDNNTDIIVVCASGGYANIQTWMAQGNSFGSFNGGQQITSGVIIPSLLSTGDFDGDGKPDLALVDEGKGPTTVQVWYGDGAGHLANPTKLTDPNSYWDRWDVNSIGDLDGNGTSDLVMAQTMGSGGSGPIQYYPTIVAFKGNTNRTLSLTRIDTPGGCPNADIQIADYNGDGLNDLVYQESPCNTTGSSNLVLNPATSKGAFSGSEQVIATSNIPSPQGWPLVNVKSTRSVKPDLVFTEDTPSGASGAMRLSLLENTTSTGVFPGCGTMAQSEGINMCLPGTSSSTTNVRFSLSASGPTPMRAVAVWADGQKVAEQLTHSFSHYSFLDQQVSLSAGTHSITLYGTGWDNTLQQKSFSLTVGSGSGSCGAPSSAGVHVCSPVNGSTVQSPVQVSAAATITGTLARMEIWVDGAKMYTETTGTTLNTSVALANGYHRFDIYAVNTAGTKWESTVYATVGASSSCAAPSSYGVHVCSPVNNSTVNSPVQATATALISGSLARMEVWVDGGKVYTETTSTSLSTSIALGAGKHKIDFYAANTQGTLWETTAYATVP